MNDTTNNTIESLLEQYNNDEHRYNEESNKFYQNPNRDRKSRYNGFVVDYDYYTTELGKVIQKQFNFTDKQRIIIMDEAYDRYHSSFSDMFYGVLEMARFVNNVIHSDDK